MLVTKKQYAALHREHISFLLLKNDDDRAISFVRQLLEMELAAAEQTNATEKINKLNDAIDVLKTIQDDLILGAFGSNS